MSFLFILNSSGTDYSIISMESGLNIVLEMFLKFELVALAKYMNIIFINCFNDRMFIVLL